MSYEKYAQYSAEMLVEDEQFRQWVKSPDQDTNAFWQAYLRTYPAQKGELNKARTMLQAIVMHFDAQYQRPEIEASFKQVQGLLQDPNLAPVVALQPRWNWMKIAASVAFILGLGFLGWKLMQKPLIETYATAYGQQELITLPDGSKVSLNANSNLRVKSCWKKGCDREVWLKGEAYFAVQKIPSTRTKFIVHTPGLDIEVLGTHFNVNTKQVTTAVALEEGSIQLSYQKDQQLRKLGMKPGDVVLYNRSAKTLKLNAGIDTKTLSSWKDGVLMFESATLNEVTTRMEEIYKVRLLIDNESIRQLPLRASLPTNNLEECLETLELLLLSEGIGVTRQGDTIRLNVLQGIE